MGKDTLRESVSFFVLQTIMYMNIGLFFGSFNPIHSGHLMLAQWIANFGGVSEVWFVVSPQNPFKVGSQLAPAEHRVAMVHKAVANSPQLRVCDVELHLPLPSYTANTLCALHSQYPQHEFTLIMGADNVEGLPRWKRAEEILAHRILVYPRPNCPIVDLPNSHIEHIQAPQIEISSTMIREWVANGKNINHFVPFEVAQYISEHKLYRYCTNS